MAESQKSTLKAVMDKKIQTTNTYNRSAQSLAEKFDKQGARTSDIEETLSTLKDHDGEIRALEIGCGNGRDAAEIVKRVDDYLGVDISENLIDLAREKVPEADFEVADIESYDFPENLDAVFAFASLIHAPKDSLRNVFERVKNALNDGGVFRISLKYADQYAETTKEDEFGIRTYYLYSERDIESFSSGFSLLKSEVVDFKGQKWLEILLRKTA